MISELYKQTNYSSNILYLNNIFIREYDISKANINVLYSKNLIDKDTYNYLYNAERMTRQVYVGKMLKDPNLVKELQSGILEARKNLFESNNIQDHEVLSIKNDAVYIINRQLQNTSFGLIEFKDKNVYTAFYQLNHLEVYYYYSVYDNKEVIDIKGIDNNTLEVHKEYFLQFLKDVFYTVQVSGFENAMKMLKGFYLDYINLQLPVGYYRNFNNKSTFHYKNFTFINTGFYSDSVLEKDKTMLDISYNISILLELQKILSTMYFNKYH